MYIGVEKIWKRGCGCERAQLASVASILRGTYRTERGSVNGSMQSLSPFQAAQDLMVITPTIVIESKGDHDER